MAGMVKDTCVRRIWNGWLMGARRYGQDTEQGRRQAAMEEAKWIKGRGEVIETDGRYGVEAHSEDIQRSINGRRRRDRERI